MAPHGPVTMQFAGVEIQAIVFFKYGSLIFDTKFNLSFRESHPEINHQALPGVLIL